MSGDFQHRARKRFGQNFLQDEGIIRRIVAAVPPENNDTLLEIGPGQGALTAPLLDSREAVTAVEVDRDLAAHLRLRFSHHPGFQLINDDILRTNIDTLADGGSLTVVGNLPYNISTPLIFHLLERGSRIRRMVFMLQMEVVDRMCAAPGQEGYGRLSVMVQYYCQVEKLFLVPPTAFRPVPKVWSAVVSLEPHTSLPVTALDPELFATVVRDAFNQRRKTLRNSLKHLIDGETLQHLGIDDKLRPEALSTGDYVSISNALARQGQQA